MDAEINDTSNLTGSSYQRKFYGEQKSEGIPLENINEEAALNNNNEPEPTEAQKKLQQNEKKENIEDNNKFETTAVENLDQEVFNDFLLKNRKKSCCTKHNCLRCCRKFIAFMISRVGLLFAMIGYVLAGGLIFNELESENENLAITKAKQNVDTIVNVIYNKVRENSIEVHDQEFGYFLKLEIEHFRDNILKETVNGTLISSNTKQWNLFGAIFYSVTLLSTIGYGHITCKTRNGKIFTIIYSAIGIPLMMLFVANTGSSTATMFKFIYLKLRSFRRQCRTSSFERQHFRNFDYDNQFLSDLYEMGDFEKFDDMISSGSLSDAMLKRENRKRFSIKLSEQKQFSESDKKVIDNPSTKSITDGNKLQDSVSTYDNLNGTKIALTMPNDEYDVYESSAYAMHVQTKAVIYDKFDFEALNNLTKSLIANDISRDEIQKNNSLLNEVKSISLLQSPISLSSKSSDLLKRIDDLIALDENTFPPQPATTPTLVEVNEKPKSPKCVNFKEGQSAKFIENNANETDTDENSGSKMQITVNPLNNIESDKSESTKENGLDAKRDKETKKSKKFFRSFSIKSKKSGKNNTESPIGDKVEDKAKKDTRDDNIDDNSALKKCSSEPKMREKKIEPETKIKEKLEEVVTDKTLNSVKSDMKDQKTVKKPSIFGRKAFSFRVNTKKDNEERRRSAEPEIKNQVVPLDKSGSVLKPTNLTKPQGVITPSLPSPSSPFKRSETKSLIYRSGNRPLSPRKLSHQYSWMTSASQFDKQSLSQLPFTKTQWQYIYSEFQHRRQEKVGVPLLITLIIMPLYMIAGMILFSEFENWKKLDAFYFSFVTLTTIGFGDLIPGQSLSLHASELHMSISALYILVGLILIAMCFNLMKKEFKSKVKSIARKFGLSNC